MLEKITEFSQKQIKAMFLITFIVFVGSLLFFNNFQKELGGTGILIMLVLYFISKYKRLNSYKIALFDVIFLMLNLLILFITLRISDSEILIGAVVLITFIMVGFVKNFIISKIFKVEFRDSC